MSRLVRKLPPCLWCNGPATSLALVGPLANKPVCADCYPDARREMENRSS